MLLYDDDGTHSAMTTAEMLARSGARLEIVTPERTVGVDVGGMNMVPYARAFNETDTRITLNQRVRTVRRDDGRLARRDRQRPLARPAHAHRRRGGRRSRRAGQRRAVLRLAEGFEQRRRGRLPGAPRRQGRNPLSGDGYQLFRIGDAVAGRNIHAAIYDALRLCKDL